MLYLNPEDTDKKTDPESEDLDSGLVSSREVYQSSDGCDNKTLKGIKERKRYTHSVKRNECSDSHLIDSQLVDGQLECSACQDVFPRYPDAARNDKSTVISKDSTPVDFESEISVENCKAVAGKTVDLSRNGKQKPKRLSEGAVASLVMGQWALSLGFWVANTVIPSIVDSYHLIYFQDGLLPTTAFVVSSSFFLSYFPYLSHNVKVLPYGFKTVRRKDGFTRWFIMTDLSGKQRAAIDLQIEEQQNNLELRTSNR